MTEEQREIRRKKRVIEYAEKVGHVCIACRRFGIARSTFYVWRDRFRESGDDGLKSRRFGAHHNHPRKTPDDLVEKILHL
ncbi:MAG: helix-turn-helix domain-containing protein, partial [Deltaproteobacteria bacterium]|nr:helix-turn-helix domain-containing protein [Deltaproteobacteria bacterium]